MAEIVREIPGAVGPLECLIDWPQAAPRAAVVFAHPLPIEGGTMHTKVVYQSAKLPGAIAQCASTNAHRQHLAAVAGPLPGRTRPSRTETAT